MINLNFSEQERATKQNTNIRSLLITTFMILTPCFVLGTKNSAFAQTAEIWYKEGQVSVQKYGSGSQEEVIPGETTMQKNRDILHIEGSWAGMAKISIDDCYDAQAGFDEDYSLYSFPNEYANKWTIGMAAGTGCLEFLLHVLENEFAQLPQTKANQFRRLEPPTKVTQLRRTNAIQVSRVGNNPTVVQTDQQNDSDGRKLVIDVLLGTVIITSPQGQRRQLVAGQRYTYFVNLARIKDVPEYIATATDCSAVNSFLDRNTWPENIRPRIDSYQPARRRCSSIPYSIPQSR